MAYRSGHSLTLLRDGTAFFPALLAAIDAAKHSVWLESYLYEADDTGLRVADALMAAARRGVQVNLLLDGFGAYALPESLRQTLAAAGVRLLFFRPEINRWGLHLQRLRRLHRKLALVDGHTGFIGGINILNDCDEPDDPPRYDYAVRVRGPVCLDISRVMRQLWQRECWLQFRMHWLHRLPRHGRSESPGQQLAALVVRDNVRHRRAIETAYLHALRQARQEIILANAYFLPGFQFRRALLAAARRGVKVTLLLQGRLDQALLQFACRGLYRQLLAAGIEVVEYRRGYMHAKVAVVDGRWATVGSSNIDPFSIFLAREANLLVQDHGFARSLRDDLRQMIAAYGVRIDQATLQQSRWWYRIVPWLAYQCVRMLMGLAGIGGRQQE
ncbi:cardiolipin synthase ClsB [Leeia sp.]|uniref:cardiolipin synthase ClsB n=1 Tax=Leeia sp. TaxID=2884678 RepID=UPI0035B25137